MNKPVKLKDTIVAVLDAFNQENEKAGNSEKYSIEIIEQETLVRAPKNKVKAKVAKAFIGRLVVYRNKDGKRTAIHQLGIPIPSTYSKRLTTDWESTLLRQFLFDGIGTFLVTVDQMVVSNQKAAFDVENQRPQVDEMFENVRIEVTRKDEDSWYEIGDTFDVFTRTDTAWAVFSDREQHLSNAGIGTVKSIHVKVIQGNRFVEASV